MMNYKLVEGIGDEFEAEVTAKLNEGWGLIGGPFISGRSRYQAMIKETDYNFNEFTEEEIDKVFEVYKEPVPEASNASDKLQKLMLPATSSDETPYTGDE